MTSRRSMQTHAERVSRALQFIPGHVGGRVASAQPIYHRQNLRRDIGGEQAPGPEFLIEWLFDQVET